MESLGDVAYLQIINQGRGTMDGREALKFLVRYRTSSAISPIILPESQDRTIYLDAKSKQTVKEVRITDPDGLALKNEFAYSGTYDLLSLFAFLCSASEKGTTEAVIDGESLPVEYKVGKIVPVRSPAGVFDSRPVILRGELFRRQGIEKALLYVENTRGYPVRLEMQTSAALFALELVSEEIQPPENQTNITKPKDNQGKTPAIILSQEDGLTDLPFRVGEALEYRLSAGGRPLGSIVLRVRERKVVNGKDCLILSLTVTNSVPGNPFFGLNDQMETVVTAELFQPIISSASFKGQLSFLNNNIQFESGAGKVRLNDGTQMDVPLGTKDLLSFFYAIRAYSLKTAAADSKDSDTRAPVFWNGKLSIFSLRAEAPTQTNTPAGLFRSQPVSIVTGDAQVDQMRPKIWLDMGPGRVPLRFELGPYLAELASVTEVVPK
jgi:hypothetical protein